MSTFKKQLFIKRVLDEDEEGESGTSSTGAGGGIEFKDFTGLKGETRDDLLPPDEKRRLMIVAERLHKASVKKEKDKRQLMQDLKKEVINLMDYRQMTNASAGQYKVNPILANKVQFSGMSPEVSINPVDSLTQTNDELQNKLNNEYRLTHQLRNEIKREFNPKPRPY